MDGVGEHDPAVIPRPFESAEVAAQHLHAPEAAILDGVPQPLGGRIETENMPHLEDTPEFSASSASWRASCETKVIGFSTKTSMPLSINSRHS